MFVQNEVRSKKIDLAWSFMVDYENSENPNIDEKEIIAEWKKLAKIHVSSSDTILQKGKELESTFKIRPKNALHLACAIEGGCGYFLTTDKQLLKKFAAKELDGLQIVNPVGFVFEMEDDAL